MKKILSLLLGISLLNNVLADEGMLIPSLIKAFESDMKAKGMRLSAEDIYKMLFFDLEVVAQQKRFLIKACCSPIIIVVTHKFNRILLLKIAISKTAIGQVISVKS